MAANRRLAAIMFTDTVGYTASTQTDEGRTLDLLRQQAELVHPLLAVHQGREVKSTGDGFLVEFDSALKATQCAVSIQRRIYERNAEGDLTPIQIRIGIHLGDVVKSGTDILGDAVNIAARIEPLAEPGGICVSGAVREQIWNKIPETLEKLPQATLKGLQLPMDIYRVVLPWKTPTGQQEMMGPPRLAVLPLANISPDSKDEYFADGLTEELISKLSKIRGLRVIARTSVGQYKTTSKTVAQIGAELGATSVLEGSVRKAGSRLRITLQLIDANTQDHLWADSYDRELNDVFAIQTEIAESTAGALQLELVGRERPSVQKEPTSSLAAYSLYLQGIQHIHRPASEGYSGRTESIKFFEEAIRLDPGFSQAYAQLANVLIALEGDTLPPEQAFPRARGLVARALELDPNSSEAHMARGNLALQCDHDWEVAETEFKQAISLNPSYASAHGWFVSLLKATGRYEEALKEVRIAHELDPLRRPFRWGLISIQCLLGNLESALAMAEAEVAREPSFLPAHIGLGLVNVDAGRIADARKQAEIAGGCVSQPEVCNLAVLWALVGNPDEARRIVNELVELSRTQYVGPDFIAEIWAALGEREKALEWLERNQGEGAGYLWARYQSRAYDPIREDPKFRTMLEKLRLPVNLKRLQGRATVF